MNCLISSHIFDIELLMFKKKNINPLDQVIKKGLTLCSTEVEASGLIPSN